MLQGHYSFVYVCKEILQYEVSMTVYLGRITNQKKYKNWCHLKNCKSESLNI